MKGAADGSAEEEETRWFGRYSVQREKMRTKMIVRCQPNTSNAIVDAQLTHPVSRDNDAEMPAAPLTHDIATPRRRIGGRCRKWAVSTQQPADKRRYASCLICGLQFAHGEARLQQWSNRDSNNAYVHAQCINGGVARDHDHELHPKLPTDQDAVETTARQRACIIQAAADSEIILPLTATSDQSHHCC